MAFVCSDCVTWIKSKDANRYGEKYCDYDQKYRNLPYVGVVVKE